MAAEGVPREVDVLCQATGEMRFRRRWPCQRPGSQQRRQQDRRLGDHHVRQKPAALVPDSHLGRSGRSTQLPTADLYQGCAPGGGRLRSSSAGGARCAAPSGRADGSRLRRCRGLQPRHLRRNETGHHAASQVIVLPRGSAARQPARPQAGTMPTRWSCEMLESGHPPDDWNRLLAEARYRGATFAAVEPRPVNDRRACEVLGPGAGFLDAGGVSASSTVACSGSTATTMSSGGCGFGITVLCVSAAGTKSTVDRFAAVQFSWHQSARIRT